MKGFPNQIPDITKLTSALSLLAEQLDSGLTVDEGSFGETLVRNGIISWRNKSETADQYLARMTKLRSSNQSHRTRARGLKQFFGLAGLTIGDWTAMTVTDIGHQLLETWDTGDEAAINDLWRLIARGIEARDSAGNVSHPYQLLLRLLIERPGTLRALCPVIFEAVDDSEEEFARILALRDLGDEEAIITRLDETESNWDNAKKILPAIAEQLGDAVRGTDDGLYVLTTAPGSAPLSMTNSGSARTPSSRPVTPDTIAQTKGPDDSDEGPGLGNQPGSGLVDLAEAILQRAQRSYRHNQLVQAFARALPNVESLWEGEFDLLAVVPNAVPLAEMKTLDGSTADELRQVRYAVAQLLYYEALSLPAQVQPELTSRRILKLAVFESRPSDDHTEWMEGLGIAVVWESGGAFAASSHSRHRLTGLLGIQFS